MSLLSFYQPAVHAFESQSYYIVNVSLNQRFYKEIFYVGSCHSCQLMQILVGLHC